MGGGANCCSNLGQVEKTRFFEGLEDHELVEIQELFVSI